MQAEKILEELRMNFQRSGKNTVNSWMKKIIEGLKELNFEDVDFFYPF